MKLKRIILLFPIIMLMSASCIGPIGSQETTSGVAKTTNGGSDWMLSNKVVTLKQSGKKTTTQITNVLADKDVSVLRFDPQNSQKIFAGTNDGVYFSEDSADSWTQVLSKTRVSDLVIEQGNGSHVYVAGLVAGNGKVLETTDQGKSWQEIYNEASPENPVTSIVINSANSKELVIGTASGNAIKSTDSGHTWTLLQNFQDPILQIQWQKNGLYVLCKTRGLYKSLDAGKEFKNLSSPLFNLNDSSVRKFVNTNDTNVPSIGPSENVSMFKSFVASSASPTIYIAANNGLFKSINDGGTWSYLALPLKSNNGSAVQITPVTLGPTDSTVFVSASNTVYKSLNSGGSWQIQSIATTAVIQYILVDPHLAQTAYVGLNGGHK